MAGALVFLIGQLFLFGTTSAQCPQPCTPCKIFTNEEYEGTWNLKAEIDQRCIGSCLYQRDLDGEEMCFCDPGPTEYNTTCLGCGCKTGCDTSNQWLVVTGGDNLSGHLDSTEIISSTGVCKPIRSPTITSLPAATTAGEMVFRTLGCKKGELIFCGGSTTFVDNTRPVDEWGSTNVCYKLPTEAPNIWSTTFPGMLQQRAWFSLTLIDQNTMIAVGGIDSSGVATDSMEEYSFSTNSWTSFANLPEQRFGHCTVLSKRGTPAKAYLIVIGGSNDVARGDSWVAVDTVSEVDVDAKTTRPLASLPEKLFRPACTISCEGDIFVSGGAQGNGHNSFGVLPPAGKKVYKYTFGGSGWSDVGSLNTERWGHVMGNEGAYDNRKMSVAGGYDPTSFLASVEDSNNGGVTWTGRTTNLKVEREYAASTAVPANVFKCQG